MIGSIDWSKIEQFAGYGAIEAPVVFVGMEEGLADSDLDFELIRRSRFDKQVMDIQTAHKGMKGAAWFGPQRVKIQWTWRPMCDVMLRRSGILEPNREQHRDYQANELGRENGETLLLELLPYPHKRSDGWAYSKYGRFRNRKEYEAQIIPRRQTLIKGLIGRAHRDAVICYGKRNWPHYEELFPGANWRSIGNFRSAKLGSTIVLLTPHFSRHMRSVSALASLFGAIGGPSPE